MLSAVSFLKPIVFKSEKKFEFMYVAVNQRV